MGAPTRRCWRRYCCCSGLPCCTVLAGRRFCLPATCLSSHLALFSAWPPTPCAGFMRCLTSSWLSCLNSCCRGTAGSQPSCCSRPRSSSGSHPCSSSSSHPRSSSRRRRRRRSSNGQRPSLGRSSSGQSRPRQHRHRHRLSSPQQQSREVGMERRLRQRRPVLRSPAVPCRHSVAALPPPPALAPPLAPALPVLLTQLISRRPQTSLSSCCSSSKGSWRPAAGGLAQQGTGLVPVAGATALQAAGCPFCREGCHSQPTGAWWCWRLPGRRC